MQNKYDKNISNHVDVNYAFSDLTFFISFFFSICKLVKLFLTQSVLWVVIGIALILVFALFTTDKLDTKKIRYQLGLPAILTKFIFIISLSILLISSVSFLFDIYILFNISHISTLYPLLIIIPLLFLGSTIGLLTKLK